METDTLTHTKKVQNPFPGLRAFRPDESYLFFGRSLQVKEVSQKLIANRFVSVIGPSGIGKSSFIYCGLFPSLRNENPADNQLEWKINTMQPGEEPLQNLLKALEINQEYTQYDEMKEELKNDFEENPQNKLIFVDQFEELFRFEGINKSNQAASEQFVQMLIDLTAQEDIPIYVVITMRSDFIGNCSRYPNFTGKINDSQFLIPFMTREEKRQAIIGPVEYMEADIEDDLIDRVLVDVEEIPEQLPLMQHAMMRTWDEWQKHRNRDASLKLRHYEEIGGIAGALSVHANEAYNELPPEQRNTCAKIFRSITEITNDGRRIRRPAQIKEIAQEVDAPEAEIMQIIEPFRRKDRGLLMPPEEEILQSDSIIDISHESLIRVWGTLQTWVEEESESVKLYLRLADDAEKHQKGQAGLWTNPDLEIALDWRNKQKPTKPWGIRYHPTFDRTMWFLESSKEAQDQLLINREQKRLRDRRRRNLGFRLIVTTGVIATIAAIFAWVQSADATKAKNEAIELADIARSAKKAAEDSAKAAEDSAKSAKRERMIADVNAKEAERERKKAERERKKAELERIKAVAAKTDAENQAKSAAIARLGAEIAQIDALISLLDAESARRKAQLAREDADELRLRSIASTMAIKSLELADGQEKALVAQQAYEFHKRSNGDRYNPDIYNGLYYALKNLKDSTYNKLSGHAANVRGIVSNGNNQIYSAGSDGKIIKWDNKTRKPSQSIEQNLVHRGLAISPNGTWLACVGNYPEVQLFKDGDLKSDIKKITPKTAAGQIWFVTFLDDKRLVFADEKGNIHLGDTEGPTSSKIIKPEASGKITSIASSSKVVAYAVGEQVFLLKGVDFKEETELKLNKEFDMDEEGNVISLAMSKDGKMLAVGLASGSVGVYNMLTPSPSMKGIPLKGGHSARVNQMAFSKNGKRLATGSFDQTVRIWNIEREIDFDSPPIILDDHNDWVWSIAFSADGNTLLAGCRDNLVRTWPTELANMSAQICPELNRNMSKKEWERFVSTLSQNQKTDGKTESTIYYEETCEGKGRGEGIEKKHLAPDKRK